MAPSLSIIVPFYNEAATLAKMMKRIAAVLPEAQVVYVDDGSRDASLSIAKQMARTQDIVLTQANGGKGSAVRYGLTRANGAYTVIQDADGEYDPADIRLLLETAEKHPGCAVFGSRFLRKNPVMYFRFYAGNKVLSAWMSLLFWKRVTDSYTCYKLFPTELFRSLDLRSNGFAMEAELCAKCLRRGIRILEEPIAYAPRTIVEGKKIRLQDAWKGFWTMLLVRLDLL